MQELAEAVKGLKHGKAPGCDGLPSEFYQMFFSKINEVLLSTMNEAYREGQLYPSALRGIISLIPKKGKDCRQIKNMRPITLLNTDYKLIEKILANRLKPALKVLIDMDQKGFMTDRRISCNIRRVLDLVNFTNEED